MEETMNTRPSKSTQLRQGCKGNDMALHQMGSGAERFPSEFSTTSQWQESIIILILIWNDEPKSFLAMVQLKFQELFCLFSAKEHCIRWPWGQHEATHHRDDMLSQLRRDHGTELYLWKPPLLKVLHGVHIREMALTPWVADLQSARVKTWIKIKMHLLCRNQNLDGHFQSIVPHSDSSTEQQTLPSARQQKQCFDGS